MEKVEQSIKDINGLMAQVEKSTSVDEVNHLEAKIMYAVMGLQAVASKLDGHLTGIIYEKKQTLRQTSITSAEDKIKSILGEEVKEEIKEEPVEKPVEKTEKKVSKKKKTV